MDVENVKEKIRKCLALAESDNENESKTALLMARRLMAQYKLSEKDVNPNKLGQPIHDLETGVEFTTQSTLWVNSLAHLMANNFACGYFTRSFYRGRKRTVCFMGYKTDIEICKESFLKAYYTILNNTLGYDKNERYSYARGFIIGLSDAFNEQNRTECTDLVMVTPKEVTDIIGRYPIKSVKTSLYSASKSLENHGYTDGYNYNKARLTE